MRFGCYAHAIGIPTINITVQTPLLARPFQNRRPRLAEQQVGSLLIRAVTVSSPAGSVDSMPSPFASPRASHTPAVRAGPPLSCNFCWNTVDECGRILRRKTQYHCPECRTNLCIVPCFHEYHEAEAELASAR
ncbi:PiggyBac transposable element-derived protein 4 [Operophtera brumata]|uniref:PiggyBac transposable element-derived protein 4 n=1 Tax=Operophtera brumata TaxID=104452 RepID=A0A0L7LRH2_OPEBR|nr:PiggyBac transposable element-derived protein 4 [Operophtera brumata]